MAQPSALHSDRAQRFPLKVPIHFRAAAMPHWSDGKSVNISRTGILVRSDELPAASSILDIRVDFPKDVTLECRGTVVRNEESAFAVMIHSCRLRRHEFP